MRNFGIRYGDWRQSGRRILAACSLPGLLACLVACPGPGASTGRSGGRGARASSVKKDPQVELRKFDGKRGVFRIHNRTRHTIRRVAVALRGVGCEGPRATRTEVKVFDLRLRPGERQSFAFHFDHRCRKAHVAAAAQ